jgi:hypothetical protein
MYPRNSATPPRIDIGSVIQISDGAVQTSDVSVKVLPEGGTASTGVGTIGYEEGVVHYSPTQAETNYTAFILIAYKTGCLPASKSVVTTAMDVAGVASATLVSSTVTAISKDVLTTGMAAVESSANTLSLCTLVLAATKKANTTAHPGYLTIFRSDGVTEHVRIAVATDEDALPIAGIG